MFPRKRASTPDLLSSIDETDYFVVDKSDQEEYLELENHEDSEADEFVIVKKSPLDSPNTTTSTTSEELSNIKPHQELLKETESVKDPVSIDKSVSLFSSLTPDIIKNFVNIKRSIDISNGPVEIQKLIGLPNGNVVAQLCRRKRESDNFVRSQVSIEIWDLATHRCLNKIEENSLWLEACLSDGTIVVLHGMQKTTIYDSESLKPVHELPFIIRDAARLDNDRIIGYSFKEIIIFNTRTNEKEASLNIKTQIEKFIKLDNNKFVVASSGSLLLLQWRYGKLLDWEYSDLSEKGSEYQCQSGSSIANIINLSAEKFISIEYTYEKYGRVNSNVIRLWDTSDGYLKSIYQWTTEGHHGLHNMHLQPDGRTLIGFGKKREIDSEKSTIHAIDIEKFTKLTTSTNVINIDKPISLPNGNLLATTRRIADSFEDSLFELEYTYQQKLKQKNICEAFMELELSPTNHASHKFNMNNKSNFWQRERLVEEITPAAIRSNNFRKQ